MGELLRILKPGTNFKVEAKRRSPRLGFFESSNREPTFQKSGITDLGIDKNCDYGQTDEQI